MPPITGECSPFQEHSGILVWDMNTFIFATMAILILPVLSFWYSRDGAEIQGTYKQSMKRSAMAVLYFIWPLSVDTMFTPSKSMSSIFNTSGKNNIVIVIHFLICRWLPFWSLLNLNLWLKDHWSLSWIIT